MVRLDLSTVEPSLAGPKRPQDRVPLSSMKPSWRKALTTVYNKKLPNNSPEGRWEGEGGHFAEPAAAARVTPAVAVADPGFDGVEVELNDERFALKHGDVVIAAITSCTNTSNPSVMVAAGLLARKAVALGLTTPPHVKTSLAPGSRVVTDYLQLAGLDKDLEKVGFYTVGYGCTTCIGNSGPLPEPISSAIKKHDLVVAGVLSGNRNFEGRINPDVKANYLASPPLVVAYALAGTTDIDFAAEALGTDRDGEPVYLEDIWPSREEVQAVVDKCVRPEMFARQYDGIWHKNPKWNAIETSEGELYEWDAASTYIQEPPFLFDLPPRPQPIEPIRAARCLAAFGDSVTTDHISPAGSIAKDSPAGKYLISLGVAPPDFNSYGARRGNDRVMTRGTFANIRIRNLMAPGTEGGVTRHLPDGAVLPIYDAAMQYKEEGVPLVVLAGAEYGSGSSRDWAAKGPYLQGVRAVLAASFERIHRSNLVMMGILPLEFEPGTTWQSLGLSGEEFFDIPDLGDGLRPRQTITVAARKQGAGSKEHGEKSFHMSVRIDTLVELDYYKNGGILQTVLRKLLKA
jgi:aconitate hydratase